MRTFILLLLLTHALVSRAQTSKQEDSVMVFGGTGNELLERCNAVGSVKPGDVVPPIELVKRAKNVGTCSGYIAGIMDTYEGLYSMGQLKASSRTQRLYCRPEGVPMEQVIRVVQKSLSDHPENLHLPACGLVLVALNEAFPCK